MTTGIELKTPTSVVLFILTRTLCLILMALASLPWVLGEYWHQIIFAIEAFFVFFLAGLYCAQELWSSPVIRYHEVSSSDEPVPITQIGPGEHRQRPYFRHFLHLYYVWEMIFMLIGLIFTMKATFTVVAMISTLHLLFMIMIYK